MNSSNPIICLKELKKIQIYLKQQNTRDYLIFKIGICLGIPLSEIFGLRKSDIVGKDKWEIRGIQIQIPEELQEEIQSYASSIFGDLLFASRTGKQMSRTHFFAILKRAFQRVGSNYASGSLVMQKTFAYWAYHQGRIPISVLQRYLGHQRKMQTLAYIGSTSQSYDSVVIKALNL